MIKILYIVLLFFVCSSFVKSEYKTIFKTDKKLIGTVYNLDNLLIDSKMQGLAYFSIKDDGKTVVYFNGNTVAICDKVKNNILTLNNVKSRVMFVACKDGKEYLYSNELSGSAFDEIIQNSITCYKNSNLIQYIARKGESWFVVKMTIEPFKEYLSPEYSQIKPDSLKLSGWISQSIYTAMIDNKWHVVYEGNAGEGYDDIKSPVISTDGNLFAYAAKSDGKWKIVVNEKGDKNYYPRMYELSYEDIGEIAISPNKKNILFVGKNKNRCRMMVLSRLNDFYTQKDVTDVKLSDQLYNYIGIEKSNSNRVFEFGIFDIYDNINDISFNQDGSHYAYTAQRNNAWYLVNDKTVSEKSEGYDLISLDKGGKCCYSVKNNGLWRIKYGDVITDEYEDVKNFVLSPDEKRFAFAGKKDGKWSVIVDNIQGKNYDDVGLPEFSPQGKMVAFAAKTGKEWFVVIDGHEKEKFDYIFYNRIEFVSEFFRKEFNDGSITIVPVQVSYVSANTDTDTVKNKTKFNIYKVTDFLDLSGDNNVKSK